MRKTTEPTENISMLGGTEFSHPSYGMAQFTQLNGSTRDLFGSSIEHQNTIRLTISTASVTRNLSCDWYHPRRELIEVDMSQSQFVQLITSLNSGSGTPCTLRSTETERCVPSAPSISERKRINDEFSAVMKEVAEKLQHAENSLAKLMAAKSVTKTQLKEVMENVAKATQHIASNAAFVHSQFNEACDATVAEAKAEVEVAFQALIGRLGNQKLIEMVGVTESPSLVAIESQEAVG